MMIENANENTNRNTGCSKKTQRTHGHFLRVAQPTTEWEFRCCCCTSIGIDSDWRRTKIYKIVEHDDQIISAAASAVAVSAHTATQENIAHVSEFNKLSTNRCVVWTVESVCVYAFIRSSLLTETKHRLSRQLFHVSLIVRCASFDCPFQFWKTAERQNVNNQITVNNSRVVSLRELNGSCLIGHMQRALDDDEIKMWDHLDIVSFRHSEMSSPPIKAYYE